MTANYLVVLEHGQRNWSAYVPDVPGCVATGKTREMTLARMRVAVEMHLRGLREDGEAVPVPSAESARLEVAA